MTILPSDNYMLLSLINTWLRDYYRDLDALCEDKGIDRDCLDTRLGAIDCAYDSTLNRYL